MSQADEIRQFVRDEYIEPARSKGAKDVSVRAGDVHQKMGLTNSMPAVCGAIGTDKFLADAGVSILAREGPPNSTTTLFRFAFNDGDAFTISAAEEELRRRYGKSDVETQNLVSFVLPDGRQIALQRGGATVQLWLEDSGLSAPNLQQRVYEAAEGRHSNLPGRLNHRPSIEFQEQGFPRPVRSVRVSSVEQLATVLDLYEQAAAQRRIADNETDQVKKIAEFKLPTNLILYGPPGTGKTYSSAAEAVALCDGKLPGIPGRKALMDRFNALKEAGRIAFVTFHQSYSYEEFVEGLRPDTSFGQDGDSSSSAGFRLKPTDGVFKRVAAVAEQASQSPPTDLELGGRNFFKMSLGSVDEDEDVYRDAIERGYISLDWGTNFDWSEPVYENFGAILERWQAEDPKLNSLSSRVRQSHYMRTVMKEGDIVIVSCGNTEFRAIGEVIGPYQYDPNVEQFRHRRKVRWLRVFGRALPVETVLKGEFTQPALYKLDRDKLNLSAIATLIGDAKQDGDHGAPPLPYVLIIDEINRANVSKVFGELITLIEPDKRLGCMNALKVTLPYSRDDFGVPANLHIIGTMNTADRSIALLDTALRRRFQFKELMPNPEHVKGSVGSIPISAILQRINERIEYLFDREHQIGHAYFMDCDTRERLDDVMRDKVIPLLTEYFYDDWEKVRLVLSETSDEGGFIVRSRLSVPRMTDDQDLQERFRYQVRANFAEGAYEGLMR